MVINTTRLSHSDILQTVSILCWEGAGRNNGTGATTLRALVSGECTMRADCHDWTACGYLGEGILFERARSLTVGIGLKRWLQHQHDNGTSDSDTPTPRATPSCLHLLFPSPLLLELPPTEQGCHHLLASMKHARAVVDERVVSARSPMKPPIGAAALDLCWTPVSVGMSCASRVCLGGKALLHARAPSRPCPS